MKYLKTYEDVVNPDTESGIDAKQLTVPNFGEVAKPLGKKKMAELLDKKKSKKKEDKPKDKKKEDKKANIKKIKESVVNATTEEALAYYMKIKRTHFAQKGDFSEDAPMAHTTTKFFNDLTRKWEDISLTEVSDRIKSLEEEIESK